MSLNVAETQKVLFDLLIYFDEICKKHDILYWIDGGTLLGAKRYEKFIPWDDDIDVCVLQEDYDKIVAVFQEEVPKTKNYVLYNSARHKPHFTEYLGDCTTLKGGNKMPVQIDIIRVKKIHNTEESIAKDKRMVNLFKYYLHKPYDPEMNKGFEEEKFIIDKNFKKRPLFYQYFINDYLNSLPTEGKDLLYNYAYNASYVSKERPYYVEDDMFPLSTITFEGKEFPCPHNVDSYLTKLYGENYMQPPPKDKQLPSSPKSIKNIFPRFITKKWIYFIYFLKEIKNNQRMKKK